MLLEKQRLASVFGASVQKPCQSVELLKRYLTVETTGCTVSHLAKSRQAGKQIKQMLRSSFYLSCSCPKKGAEHGASTIRTGSPSKDRGRENAKTKPATPMGLYLPNAMGFTGLFILFILCAFGKSACVTGLSYVMAILTAKASTSKPHHFLVSFRLATQHIRLRCFSPSQGFLQRFPSGYQVEMKPQTVSKYSTPCTLLFSNLRRFVAFYLWPYLGVCMNTALLLFRFSEIKLLLICKRL